MQMNRVVIAGCVEEAGNAASPPSGTPVANVRVGESVRYADAAGKHWNSRTGTVSVFTESLPMSPGRSRWAQRIRRWPDRPTAVHRALRQQTAHDDRG